MGWMESEWGNNRWGMDIDHVPVTIGADDGTPYELIFATLADFKSTWGTMDQNYVIHFSDPLEWVHATDPVLSPFNTDPVYYVKTTGEKKNEVVIGNLADDRRDDCLKFDGVDDTLEIPYQTAGETRRTVISNGLKLPVRAIVGGNYNQVCRYERYAVEDMSGTLSFVFSTFYVNRPDSVMEEIPFTSGCRAQVGIEPQFLESVTGLSASTKIVSSAVDLVDNPNGYVTVDIDLGATVISKGQKFGLWVVLETPDKLIYDSRYMGSATLNNESRWASDSDVIGDNFIKTVNKGYAIPQDWKMGFCPVAIIGNVDNNTKTWAIIGDSLTEGSYEAYGENGDQRGDLKANGSFGEKIINGNNGAPVVSLAKGGDGLKYADSIQKRLKILEYCNVDYVLNAMGANDYNSISQANIRGVYNNFNARVRSTAPSVKRILGITLFPRSSSTDNWLTTANQTPDKNSAGTTSNRGSWNVAFRNNEYEEWGLDGYIDVAQHAEYDWSNYTGIWNVTGVEKGVTVDGTHFGSNGSALCATGQQQILIESNQWLGVQRQASNKYVYSRRYGSAVSGVFLSIASIAIESPNGGQLNLEVTQDTNDIDLLYCGNAIKSTINGFDYYFTCGFHTNLITTKIVIGKLWGGTNYEGVLNRFVFNDYSYINNGDFGSVNLPSTPSGNDGTIISAQWWKKDVDQAFADPLTYRSQLPAIPVEVQHVTDVRKLDIYKTNDPFWNPYNQDPIYLFKVLTGLYTFGMSSYPCLGIPFKQRNRRS